MKKQCAGVRSRVAGQGESSASLSECKVTIIGLDRVGRLVAEQLAALGVGALTLADGSLVTARTQRGDGFTIDDVGRRRTAVVAQRCQEINPQLEVRLHAKPVANSIGGGHAVVCPLRMLAAALRVVTPRWNGFVATWTIKRATAQILTVRGSMRFHERARGLTRLMTEVARPPVSAAYVIAGIVAHQLDGLFTDQAAARQIDVDMRDLRTTVIT